MTQQTLPILSNQIIRLAELKIITGLSRSSLYAKMDLNSSSYDEKFPRRIKLGARAVGWLKGEVDAWLDSMISMSIVEREQC